MNADLRALVREYYDAEGDRDPASLHVSDLVDCKRAVHARRSGEPQLPFTPESRLKFDLGRAVEDMAARWFAPLEPKRGVVVYIDGVEGNVDFVIDGAVIEVKSTTFFPVLNPNTNKRERVAPTSAQHHYRLQAAAYALALELPKFCVVIVCRDSGIVAEIWHYTVEFADEIRRLVAEYKVETDPSAPVPPAEPPKHSASWRCKYCRYAACEKNANEAAMMVGT